jgi:hypothetical protein
VRLPRLTAPVLALAVVVPTAVVAPTFTAAPATPHPVAAEVQRLPLSGVAEGSLASAEVPAELGREWRVHTDRSVAEAQRAAQRPPIVLTDQLSTEGFRMLAVTWRGAAPSSDGAVVVSARTRTGGTWSDWFEIHTNVDIGTEASPNGRFGTEPHWVGDSDGVQVRVDAVGVARPTDVRADLIEPGTSAADDAITGGWQASSASASTNRPPIVTRAEWGADESLRDKRLENNATVEVAFVHHTAGSNNYSRGESPAVVRGLYSYYVRSLGYGDMGYNFLVDKYGTIYEGRAGSITQPVRSAATGGFNRNSLSIVAMGNFETAPASDAMVAGIAKVAAYRLSRFHRDPFGRKTLTAEIGSSRYDAGEKARFRVISGHRDAGYTACPGGNLYRRLPDIRRLAARQMGSSLVEPSVSRHSVSAGQDAGFGVTAGVMQRQNWTLTVRERCSNTVVRRLNGTAGPGNPIDVVWRGRDDSGREVAPGRYLLELTSSGDGTSAWPYRATVVKGVGGGATAPTRSSLPAPAGSYVPQQPQTLLSTTTGQGIPGKLVLGAGRRLDVQVLGRAGVPNQGVSAVALSVEAACASNRTKVFVGPSAVEGVGSRAVSLGPNGTARGFVIARVGPDGAVRFQNSAGTVALRASVVGYVSTDGGGGSLLPLRRSTLPGAAPLSVGTSPATVSVAGRAGVPGDARAVVLVVRRGAASKVGSLWAWPESGSRPQVASWRRPTGTSNASQVIVPLGGTGRLQVAADRAGQVSLQVAGYVAASTERAVHAVVPKPLARQGMALAKGRSRTVSVAGRHGVPNDATAVVLSLAGSADKHNAGLTVWPKGAKAPRSPDLLVPRGGGRESVAVVRIGSGGDIRLGASGAKVRGSLTVLGWVR